MNKEKQKLQIDFIIISKNRYYGIDWDKRKIKEVDFKTAFGIDFFDWGNMIFIGSERNKQQYEKNRGTGLFNFIHNQEYKRYLKRSKK